MTIKTQYEHFTQKQTHTDTYMHIETVMTHFYDIDIHIHWNNNKIHYFHSIHHLLTFQQCKTLLETHIHQCRHITDIFVHGQHARVRVPNFLTTRATILPTTPFECTYIREYIWRLSRQQDHFEKFTLNGGSNLQHDGSQQPDTISTIKKVHWTSLIGTYKTPTLNWPYIHYITPACEG